MNCVRLFLRPGSPCINCSQSEDVMIQSLATHQTLTASRYLTRLCNHWKHRFAVTFDDHHGCIDTGSATLRLQATDSTLTLALHAPAAEINNLERVVEEHLQRFFSPGQQSTLSWARTASDATRLGFGSSDQ
ncbi:DUF2218 domain-containing protein [Pseudomonas sp. Je.1.5.c]|uniref:DUF2218 domain-containing protein n=1 Tax=Pseudomonas sp. Je.1.5.c TaxID=3142839 RepID=UPI003DA869E6